MRETEREREYVCVRQRENERNREREYVCVRQRENEICIEGRTRTPP